MHQILIIDDSEVERKLLASLLRNRFGLEPIEASGGEEALQILNDDHNNRIAACLLDLSMPDVNGQTLLPKILSIRPELSVIVVTGTDKIADVVEVIRLGASDYLVKPPNLDLFHNALSHAIKLHELRLELRDLHHQANEGIGFKLVADDRAMQTCMRLVRRATGSDISVLITGESGVGKEVIARTIHAESTRKDKPFVAINCGAIPKDLVESTLFGHKKGAFTGALIDQLGKFREADGGTLFLDEIGELPLAAQVKLLRALQEREVQPVGGSPTSVNIRIITATNRDLHQAINNGEFREDLFFRLNVFPIHIPPLRQRRDDILPLATHFMKKYAAAEQKDIIGFMPEAESWLYSHSWPGNVRELENTIFRGVLLCDKDKICLEHIMSLQDRAIPKQSPQADTIPPQPFVTLTNQDGSFKTMAVLREEIEQHVLTLHKGNIDEAARILGIGRSTLYRRRKE